MLNYWVGRGLRRFDEWVIFGRVRNVLSSYMMSKHGLPFPNQLYYKSFSIDQIVCPHIRFSPSWCHKESFAKWRGAIGLFASQDFLFGDIYFNSSE